LDFGREMGDLKNPYYEFNIFKEWGGAYPVHLVADCFVTCDPEPTLVVMSRHYQRTELEHAAITVILESSPHPVPLPPGRWYIKRNYETIAIGRFMLPGNAGERMCAGAPPGPSPSSPSDLPPHTPVSLPITLIYKNTSVSWSVQRSPEPPRSQFAIAAVFSFSRYFLPLWLDYWYAIGVETFYLFYNGDSLNPTNMTLVLEEVKGFRGSIVILDWSVMHWIDTDDRDITCGQPIAINDALIRWGHLHNFMGFYDTDEFLVLPGHTNLAHFYASWAAKVAPIVALRSQSSWGLLNLSSSAPSNIEFVRLHDLGTLQVVRGPVGGREKYFINTSAVSAWGIESINLHGVYSHQVLGAGGASGEPDILLSVGEFSAYHLHLLNTPDNARARDSREVFLPKKGKEIINDELKDFLRRALVSKVSGRSFSSKVKGVS